jgi:hypothetical protein
MLIVALVMAVIGLAALVTAVVTSNQIIAWVCIGASVIGVVLLIVDALRERRQRDTAAGTTSEGDYDAEYPEDKEAEDKEAEDEEPEDKEGKPEDKEDEEAAEPSEKTTD